MHSKKNEKHRARGDGVVVDWDEWMHNFVLAKLTLRNLTKLDEQCVVRYQHLESESVSQRDACTI